jgi:hypothetical protein
MLSVAVRKFPTERLRSSETSFPLYQHTTRPPLNPPTSENLTPKFPINTRFLHSNFLIDGFLRQVHSDCRTVEPTFLGLGL